MLSKVFIKKLCGVFLLQCDFDPKDYEIDNRFYYELIQFWAEFRNSFSEQDGKTFIIWNNKNIRINGKPVFYKQVFEKKLISISQLKLQQNNLESLESTRRDLDIHCNFLVWAGLRSAIPPSSRAKEDEVRHLDRLGFYYNKKFFDVTLAKSREYYKLLIQLTATLPKSASKFQDKSVIDSIY